MGGDDHEGAGNGGVVDFVGGFEEGGGGEFEEEEEEGEGGEGEEGGDDDDEEEEEEEEEEELELHVDEDGRLAFDGGEMDYAVRCVF